MDDENKARVEIELRGVYKEDFDKLLDMMTNLSDFFSSRFPEEVETHLVTAASRVVVTLSGIGPLENGPHTLKYVRGEFGKYNYQHIDTSYKVFELK